MPGKKNHHTIMSAIAGRADLGEAIDILNEMPEDTPMRRQLAVQLVDALLQSDRLAQSMGGDDWMSRTDGLLAIVDQNPPSDPRWPVKRALIRSNALMVTAVQGRLADPGAALAEVEKLAVGVGDDPLRLVIESAGMAIAYMSDHSIGDMSVYGKLLAVIGKMRSAAAGNPQAEAMLDALGSVADLMLANQRGDNLTTAFDEFMAIVSQLPPGNDMSDALVPLQIAFSMKAAVENLSPVESAVSVEHLDMMRQMANRTDVNPSMRARAHSVLGNVFLGGGQETDVDRITDSIRHFRAAVDLEPDDRNRVFYLASLAMGLWRRNELTNSQDDLNAAAEALLLGQNLAKGPQHPQWSLINDLLSSVQVRRGDPAAHKIALDGLRNNVWRVLLQGDESAAKYAAADAADSAVSAARLSLAESDLFNAIRSLDSGRSLMLFAAAEFRDVVPRLVEIGQGGLAEQWQQAIAANGPNQVPPTLRRDVLSALTESSDILDPPKLTEIRHALKTLDADALVYLVPADSSGQPGWAVIAPAEGPPASVVLPHLLVEDEYDVERYLSVLSSRDLAPPRQRAKLVESLEGLCSWAWRSAVGPIVEEYLSRLPRPASGRPYRMILVPMGVLALIPWNAARRRDGKYAIEDVAFSLAPSARLLCRSAALSPVPLVPIGLVVGDPDAGDEYPRLFAARVEAEAIHHAFYFGGRYIGTRADGSPSSAGSGAAQEIREWLTDTRLSAGAMIHLACHGVTETDPQQAKACLVLADGGRLAAEEIVQLLGQVPERNIALAVLAACRTGRSIHGYDESYSLGTAFLVGGVRTVLSTQWSIPDQATSLLMFMFHHYLVIDRLPTWAALRQAQLWMLDPDREAPEAMPPLLRQQLTDLDIAHVDSWAGFIHLGQ